MRAAADFQTKGQARFNHDALVELLRLLKATGYRFITPTLPTHEVVVSRQGKQHAENLRDIFGWSLPFDPEMLPADILAALRSAGALEECWDGVISTLRVASLGEDLFLHSAYPPSADDAVFFGPDTYRFALFLTQAIGVSALKGRAVDVGAGSGAGAVVLARAAPDLELVLTDVNAVALELARANLDAADVKASFRLGRGLVSVASADLIVANPPFIADPARQTYRDGGDMHGAQLSLDWALEGAGKLSVGGRLMLYTGSAIIQGKDLLHAALEAGLPPGFHVAYHELDPDIFGGQLSQPAYRDVERIAAIGAVITRIS